MKLILSILLSISFFSWSQLKSPFNDLPISIKDSTAGYSFIVSGHFYGGSSNTTGYPTNTVLGNVDNFNNSDASFLMCLGDLFMDVKNDIPYYERSFFSRLKIPLYNTVGNHDLSGSTYYDNFGDPTATFIVNKDYHVIIDTENDNGDIINDQVDLLKDALNQAKSGKIDNLFVYGHRTLWVDSYPEMNGLFSDNTQSLTSTNFETEILPILIEIGKHCNVYWFAGSLGGAPASFFYHSDEERNIKYIGTAIRGLPRDAVLHVNSNQNSVSFEVESLTGQQLQKLEDYNVEYWKKNGIISEPFNWRLVPLYIKNVFIYRYFWYGSAFGIILMLAINWILIRRRKKKNKPTA